MGDLHPPGKGADGITDAGFVPPLRFRGAVRRGEVDEFGGVGAIAADHDVDVVTWSSAEVAGIGEDGHPEVLHHDETVRHYTAIAGEIEWRPGEDHYGAC